jgi:16S rRNA G966 N2-methylase RsmD
VAGFIAAGQHLAQAKEALGLTGYVWENWLKDELRMSRPAASYLIAIGQHEYFQDRHNYDDLAAFPRYEQTVYQLSQLSVADLTEAVESGAVYPELKLDEAKAIVGSYKARAAMPDIRHGDFREVLKDVTGVHLIVTDPPYGDDAVKLYGDLAAWAATALVPGGSLIAYAGQSTLPAVFAAMGEQLRYWWTLSVEHSHGGQQLPGKWVIAEWKPAVWFVRGHREGRDYVADRVRGTRPDKEAHDWAQGSAEVLYLIQQLTEPGQLVADPFAGSGSFGKAALSAGRKFIGADLPGKVNG